MEDNSKSAILKRVSKANKLQNQLTQLPLSQCSNWAKRCLIT